ncbi:hypothetical protein [Aerococcus viridans]|uniref:hypothetical protein n=1 Tax=Aerococcus viridans TaxID=1377 RepID=UPI0015E0FDC0|nr:hypothetical protein [Aerococcus viridans]
MNIAEKNLESINIQNQKLVQNLALQNSDIKSVKVKSIKYKGKQDVYNMEVPNHHNYSVAGGFIIHNCIDATRYAFADDMRPVKQSASYATLARGIM